MEGDIEAKLGPDVTRGIPFGVHDIPLEGIMKKT